MTDNGDAAPRHAVILAGGKGARLRPYTTSLPKPLVPIGDEHSILEIVLRQLVANGFLSVTLAIGHLGQLVRAYVGDGSQWGVSISYTHEDTPLGTIGPILPILGQLPEHFLVMNGDVLTNISYADVLDHHIESGSPLTVATYHRELDIDFGVLEINGSHIVDFTEKPRIGYDVSMGIYAVSRSTLVPYPAGQALGFDELVLDLLRRDSAPTYFPFEGYWRDIGRPEDYDSANAEFASRRSELLPMQAMATLADASLAGEVAR